MPKPADAIELWNGELPGLRRPGHDSHPRAAERPSLTLFLLPGETLRPLVVVLPGGGYANRAEHEADPVAIWLNGIGLHAAVCHYRVFPWLHPAPLMDAQRAVRTVRMHAGEWRVDSSRVGILGFSAGGHLACSAANFGDEGESSAADAVGRQPSAVNGLIACYPVITFGPARHDGSMRNLLGDPPDPALRQELSLENTVTGRNPPTFIWHTANDGAVPVANSLLYAEALAKAKVPLSMHIYPNAHHGIGLGRDFPGTARNWTRDCEAWLAELGWC